MGVVFFSDLDGTLLDHRSYSFAPALPAIAALKAAKIPLVLATSKTAAEVRDLHRKLDLGAVPAIVENGAGILSPSAESAFDDSAYARIRAHLDTMPRDLRAQFQGFGDLSDSDVADITGLAPNAAKAARTRAFSEPGRWLGDDTALAAFTDALSQHGIRAQKGGRFLTLSEGRSKADAMADVLARLGAQRSVALGDAPNDIQMLEAADLGVIIRNDASAPLAQLRGEAEGRIRRSALEGPAGWNAAVLEILTELGIGPAPDHPADGP